MTDRPQRTARLTIRLSDDERRRLVRRAEACGVSLSGFVRRAALGAVPRARPGRVHRQAVAHLTRLANHLQELARVAGERGRLPARRRLLRLVRRIEAAVRELVA